MEEISPELKVLIYVMYDTGIVIKILAFVNQKLDC